MSDVLFRYEVDQTIEIFQTDAEFLQVIQTDEGITLQTIVNEEIVYSTIYRDIVEILLENKTYISNYNIAELNAESPPFVRSELAEAYGVDFISVAAYKQTLYTFKYASVKAFFKNNYEKFLPDYDYLKISSQEKIVIFQEAFMREYDRFADIIDRMYNIVDIDKIPEEYLNYLAQAIGYEREDQHFLKNTSFRELIKNIVEIYRIKGTNYSFELFFNFLGFSATIKEYWFDKRFSDSVITINPETLYTDSDDYRYYLTSTKPTDYIPEDMGNPYAVSDDLIVPTLSALDFNKFISDGTYTANQLLGIDAGYPDQTYTYFKTNIVEYILDILVTIGDETSQITAEEVLIIQRYITFLTPLFILKNINVVALPIEDDITELLISDDDSTIDDAVNPDLNIEKHFRSFQGLQPINNDYKPYDPIGSVDAFKWGDGYFYYNETLPQIAIGYPRDSGGDIEEGGHFISGRYSDTYSAIYDPTIGSGSVYNQLITVDPIAYYSLNGDSTEVINGYDGTDENISYATGYVNLGAYFSGSDPTGIDLPAAVAKIFDPSKAFSFSCWVKLDTLSPSNSNPRILRISEGGGIDSFCDLYYDDSNERFTVIVWDGTGSTATANQTASGANLNWTHLVVTWDGADTLNLYVDTIAFTDTEAQDAANATKCEIGGSEVDRAFFHLEGLIDEMVFYNYTINYAKVVILFNTPVPVIFNVSTNEEILQKISELISANELFYTYSAPSGTYNFYIDDWLNPPGSVTYPSILGDVVVNYGISNRDLLYPFIDGGTTAETTERHDKLYDGSYYKFTYDDEDHIPSLAYGSSFSDSDEEDITINNTALITNMVLDNGSGQGQVTINDSRYRFKYMPELNTHQLELHGCTDKAIDGIYIVSSKSGDTFTFTTTLSGTNPVPSGFVKIYKEPWTMGPGYHSFLHEDLVITGGA